MVLTSAKSRSMIVCPYSATMALHSVLTTPDAPIAWFIMVITVCKNKPHASQRHLLLIRPSFIQVI